MRLGSLNSVLLCCAIVSMASCSSRRVEGSNELPANADVAAQLVIDQFLRAAMSNDLDSMARLFGTRNGSVIFRDPREDVDRQMFALASVLRHDSYAIKRVEVVPGRRNEATRVIVAMTIGERTVDVPYTLVYTTERTWLIEQIGITEITSRL